jgi:hypothetical protein
MTRRNMTNLKHKILNPKQYQNTNDQNLKQNGFWDLNFGLVWCLEISLIFPTTQVSWPKV